MLSHDKARLSKSRQISPEKSGSLPAWQIERANRLHRLFERVQKAGEAGRSFSQATKNFVWRWHGRGFRCDPDRKVQFGRVTLERLFQVWQRGGRVPSALFIRYKPAGPAIPAPVVCRFIECCARFRFPSLKTAWDEFSSRRGWIRSGRLAGKAAPFSYGQVVYYFSGARFRALQSAQRDIEQSQARLARLRLSLLAEVRRRLPDIPQRRRRTRAELSLESASL